MGLDTSHDCWHGAYSAFHRWRCELAKAAGLPPLEFMEGFWISPRADNCGTGLPLTIKCAASTLDRIASKDEAERLLGCFDFQPIRWASLKRDPLHALLHHSDCEGVIPWRKCAGIADSLERLLPNLPDGDAGGHIGNWREKTQLFINGLRYAYLRKEAVDFH